MDNPGNNQHVNVLIWVGGRGGLRISTLCTIGKMLTIVNDPLMVGASTFHLKLINILSYIST